MTPVLVVNRAVLVEVDAERVAQEQKWGEQNWPDGTGNPDDAYTADQLKKLCDGLDALGTTTWRDILIEEVFEAFAESDPSKIRAELVQVAAVATAWIEAIDRRAKVGGRS